MVALDDPHFLDEWFAITARAYNDPLEALWYEENLTLCDDFERTQMQASWSWQNTHLARALAILLIDPSGEIHDARLKQAITLLEKAPYSLGPHRSHHFHRICHVQRVLNLLSDNPAYRQALHRIRRPEFHQGALALIRDTLFIFDHKAITDAHARQATLAAWLTSLRQNVGSCFATAPAIMIQQEQPLQLLADIEQLLLFGALTRTFSGKEYSMPLSPHWGSGDLLKPLLIASLGEQPLETLATAPGLHAAFTAAGLIVSSASLQEKRAATAQLLQPHREWLTEQDPFLHVTAQELIQKVLLQVHGLDEAAISSPYADPFQGMAAAFSLPAMGGGTPKERQRSEYENHYEKAKKAFKALTDNALLKAWEFTLASFSEAKTEYAKWNLYLSLGFSPEEPFGIGQTIQTYIQKKVDTINADLRTYQSQYDHLYAQAKSLEGQIGRGSTTREAEWLHADYRLRRQEMDRLLVEQDEIHERGQRLVQLFPFLVDFYGQKIGDYFQEIYDADMQEVTPTPYEDSPAGFRLLYKHGRTRASVWTMIYTPQEYLHQLIAFFVAIEHDLRHLPEVAAIEKELSELITAIIDTIRRPDFLESSFHRLARAYQEPLVADPLHHLGTIKRKPWAYLSGGTVNTLVSHYYSRPNPLKEMTRWVEGGEELLAFFIDTMKELPHPVQQLYQQERHRSLLAVSPTHAFLCKPGWKQFREAWENPLYTYSWIRDAWNHPRQRFLDQNLLDAHTLEQLLTRFLSFFPSGYRSLAQRALRTLPLSLRANEFREAIKKALTYEKWLSPSHLDYLIDELDSLLYEGMPFFPEYQLKERLHQLFTLLEPLDPTLIKQVHLLIDRADVGRYHLLSAQALRNSAKGLLLQALNATHAALPWHQLITEAMQTSQLGYPAPLLIADSNWVNQYFGFTVNPGTGHIAFWRFDDCGSRGRPMTLWNRFLDGTEKKRWGLYTAPLEYGQFS